MSSHLNEEQRQVVFLQAPGAFHMYCYLFPILLNIVFASTRKKGDVIPKT